MNCILTTLFKDGAVKYGTLFDAPCCCERMRTDKCAKFYRNVFDAMPPDTFIRCPFGLAVCKVRTKMGWAIVSGLRVKSITPKGKLYGEQCFLPAISEGSARRLIRTNVQQLNQELDLDARDKFMPNLVHSLSKIFDVGQMQCEALLKRADECPSVQEHVLSLINAIMSARVIFNADDVRCHGVSYQTPYDINVHGKFLKMAKLFTNFQSVHVDFKLLGEVKYRYRLQPSFECVPYLLLENARKYSLNPKEVTITFEETDFGLNVEVSNSGPLVLLPELDSILEYGIRGRWARRFSEEGGGIGLNTAHTIAQSLGIDLIVNSIDTGCEIDSIPCGIFSAKLHIPIGFCVSNAMPV